MCSRFCYNRRVNHSAVGEGCAEKGSAMYTTVSRRRFDPARMPETRARAEQEFFPKLQQAPGFIGFYLVADEEQGMNAAIGVWENKESAEAFRSEAEAWSRTLDSMGSRAESLNRGETIVEIMPQR